MTEAGTGKAQRWLAEAVLRSTDDCVLWPFYTERGYGRMSKGHATHVVMEMTGRPWHPPLGECVLHSCDNPTCVNPRHLRWGTQRANAADRRERQRGAIGERAGRAKLCEDDVRAIRLLYASGAFDQPRLAHMYEVHNSVISRLITRQTWTHVTDEAAPAERSA